MPLVIRFSHKYDKLPKHNTTARLLQIFVCDKAELSKEFLEYDTSYVEDTDFKTGKVTYGHYPIPDGKLIVLLFISGWLFTTIRPWTSDKEVYYWDNIGKEFTIDVQGVD